MDVYEKVLLRQDCLVDFGLRPHEATLYKVIQFLNLKSSQRTQRHIDVLHALTKEIAFFKEKIEEHGNLLHFEACEKMSYEFFEKNKVSFI